MVIKIKTNNVPRAILNWFDLSKKEQKEFDWMEEADKESASFVRYKGWVYSLSEFMRVENDHNLKGWDGYSSNSFFSGILVKFIKDDYDHVIVGTYLS